MMKRLLYQTNSSRIFIYQDDADILVTDTIWYEQPDPQ